MTEKKVKQLPPSIFCLAEKWS